jgi:hypothetical protein
LRIENSAISEKPYLPVKNFNLKKHVSPQTKDNKTQRKDETCFSGDITIGKMKIGQSNGIYSSSKLLWVKHGNSFDTKHLIETLRDVFNSILENVEIEFGEEVSAAGKYLERPFFSDNPEQILGNDFDIRVWKEIRSEKSSPIIKMTYDTIAKFVGGTSDNIKTVGCKDMNINDAVNLLPDKWKPDALAEKIFDFIMSINEKSGISKEEFDVKIKAAIDKGFNDLQIKADKLFEPVFYDEKGIPLGGYE